jgi:tetratricopeptide (TPR) repeat protein
MRIKMPDVNRLLRTFGLRRRSIDRVGEWSHGSNAPDELAAEAESCLQRHDYAAALALFERIASAFPSGAEGILGMAQALAGLRQYERAEALLLEAVSENPALAKGYLLLGNLAADQGRRGDAVKFFTKAIASNGRYAEAWNNLGLIFMDVGARHKARECFTTALRHRPGMVQAACNLGILSGEGGGTAEAERWYRESLSRDERYVPALINLGVLRHETGEDDDALRLLGRALSIEPENAYARYLRGLIRLASQDFESGWDDYEYRDRGLVAGSAGYPYPVWRGEPLQGRTILIEAEQGIGDQIMFASCVPDIARSAGRCILCCSAKLGKLFRQSFPGVTVLDSKSAENVGRYEPIDYRVSIASLGRYFRRNIADFPMHRGYLGVDTAATQRWRPRLESASRLRVGISWRGGTSRTRALLRSIPLADWAPILGIEGISFYSLQYTPCEDEVRACKDKLNDAVTHWPDAIDDYYETAALVASVDLVITVQTAVAHLAGALGKPVWVLVPARPEWRYGARGEQIPWYPSARLFRQSGSEGWGQVLQRVAGDLRKISEATPMLARDPGDCPGGE